MKHNWKIGEKLIRGFSVDKCLKCGALKVMSFCVDYVKPQEATKFLTTNQPVEFCEYFPCEGDTTQ